MEFNTAVDEKAICGTFRGVLMIFKNILSKPVAVGCTVGLILLAVVMYPQSAPPRAVTDRELLEPDPADWLMWRRTLNSWGYSPLNQINKSNAGRLQLVWTRGMGPGIQEATPLVRDGVMFLPNPSDYIQALDAATGDLRWEYNGNCLRISASFFPCRASTAIWPSTAIRSSTPAPTISCSRSTR